MCSPRCARPGRTEPGSGIVHFATTKEINAALRAEPAHILHLSGHGSPGVMELEDEQGNARRLTAEQFVSEAIPQGRMPPVIALAACHTDADTATGDPSFAAALIELGARVVIGTETAITDVYATRVFTHLYGALANAEIPDVVQALSEARRAIQTQLRDSSDERERRQAALGEWAVVTVLAASGSAEVVDPSAAETPAAPAPADVRLIGGLISRHAGEFVGRRREQRRWPQELLDRGAAVPRGWCYSASAESASPKPGS